jgi:hypothetical protein
MKNLLVLALTACTLAVTYSSQAVYVESSTSAIADMTLQTDKKEARKLKRENRKATREAYKNRTGSGATKSDYGRIMKENYRQRKKMEKASRKENRRNWGRNQSGDVFQVF